MGKREPTMVAKSAKAGTAAVQQISTPIEDLVARLDIKPSVFRATTRTLLYGETKYIEWDFNDAKFKNLELIQITDMQWGHIACKRDRVREYRDWILRAPNRYMIWTGDNVDAATMQSKGTTWENTGSPQQQLFEFVQEWAPAAHRILGYVGGNHERRVLTTFGDLGITIAALLRVPYSRGQQLIDIKFGKHESFQISQWHGMGGAATIGTVAQKLYRFAAEGDSQLYFMGHHHKPLIFPFWKQRRGKQGIRQVKTFACCGSSFLDTWGSYAEVAGYGPTDVLMPRAVIGKDGSFELTLK